MYGRLFKEGVYTHHIISINMELQLRWWIDVVQHWDCRQIPVQTDEFVQILNSNSNHWVTISAVNCVPGEIQVYDHLYRTVSKDISELVVSMMHTHTHTLYHTAIHHAPDGDADVFCYFNELLFKFD